MQSGHCRLPINRLPINFGFETLFLALDIFWAIHGHPPLPPHLLEENKKQKNNFDPSAVRSSFWFETPAASLGLCRNPSS